MTRAMLRRRRSALIGEDERGFTIVETMIAITIIFASIVAMAYSAMAGFRALAYGRERVTGDGIADQIMESIRGQAYSRIQTGLSSSDLTDPNIINCGGTPVVYRFQSCAGERIVNSGGVPSTPWINPHTGTIAASATTNNVPYTWATYITNDCPTVSATCPTMNPYRVSVMVAWASAAYPLKANNLVQIQSLFSSPSGCLSSATHPFAAPCQPSFYGIAQVPSGRIDISGSIQGLTFTDGYLGLSGTESNLQNEQVTQGRASFSETQVSVTDGGGTRTDAGTLTTASAADSDPGAPGATYGAATVASGLGGSASSANNPTSIDLSAPSGDSGTADTAVAAGGASVCPPPTDPAETDNLPCVGARVQQGGALSAAMTLNGIVGGLGTVSLASVGAAASAPNKSFVNRQAVANEDGRVEVTATRRIGTVSIGDLPTGMAPAGWSGSLISLSGYQDVASSQAGSTTTAAPAAGSTAGTVSFWNGSGYTTRAVTNPLLNNLVASVSQSATIGGRAVTANISVSPGAQIPTTGTNRVSTPSGSLTNCTSEDSSVTPFKVSVHYVVIVDGVTTVDLTISINLGTMLTRSVYAPAPAAG
jgi:type II secretory pathway pseudopilin PulG